MKVGKSGVEGPFEVCSCNRRFVLEFDFDRPQLSLYLSHLSHRSYKIVQIELQHAYPELLNFPIVPSYTHSLLPRSDLPVRTFQISQFELFKSPSSRVSPLYQISQFVYLLLSCHESHLLIRKMSNILWLAQSRAILDPLLARIFEKSGLHFVKNYDICGYLNRFHNI